MKKTTALAALGVRGLDFNKVTSILKIADEFRGKLCELYQQRHEATVAFRNQHFPDLFAALTHFESVKAKIYDLEKEIKAHHSKVRDKNAVTRDQETRLKALREERKRAVAMVADRRKEWSSFLRAFGLFWKTAAKWKDVKSLDKRRAEYAAIKWPKSVDEIAKLAPPERPLENVAFTADTIENYGRDWMARDLSERELFREFQSRGLHSSIRGEIVEASQPKTSKESPGMRYVCGRKPEPEPWEKITLAIVGGASIDDLRNGTPGLRLRPDDHNPKLWQVRHQIGTADQPVLLEYAINLHRPFPPEAVVNRWTLCVRRERQVVKNKYGAIREREWLKATAVPVIVIEDVPRPCGQGVLRVDLSWSSTPQGVRVATFTGPAVNESVVLPWWLIDARLGCKEIQEATDRDANDYLASRGCTPQVNQRQGVSALADYCREHRDDMVAREVLDYCLLDNWKSIRDMRRAIRARRKIFETVAKRVCERHAVLVADTIDLATLKKYDERDLLRVDPLPARAREIMHAAAPGELAAIMKRYGLPTVASGDVIDEPPGDARSTDLFTTYVANIGRLGEKTTETNAAARKS